MIDRHFVVPQYEIAFLIILPPKILSSFLFWLIEVPFKGLLIQKDEMVTLLLDVKENECLRSGWEKNQ